MLSRFARVCRVPAAPRCQLFRVSMSTGAAAGGGADAGALGPTAIDPATTTFMVCDIQDRFRAAVPEFESLISCSRMLIGCAQVLSCPVIVTEQYPKALGHTVEELKTALDATPDTAPAPHIVEKTRFSMVTPEVAAMLDTTRTVVLSGLEAHVCILNTVLDLLRMGIKVYVVTDAVASQRMFDRTIAFQRIRDSGGILTTVESVMFELIQDKAHPAFKTISGFAKEYKASPSGLAHL